MVSAGGYRDHWVPTAAGPPRTGHRDPPRKHAQNRPRGPNQGQRAQNRPAGPIQRRGPQGPLVNPGAYQYHNDDNDGNDNGITMRRILKWNDTEKQIGNHSRVAHTHDFLTVFAGNWDLLSHPGCALRTAPEAGPCRPNVHKRTAQSTAHAQNTSAPVSARIDAVLEGGGAWLE